MAANVDSRPTLPSTALTSTVESGCVATSTSPFAPNVNWIFGNSLASVSASSSNCTETNSGFNVSIISRVFSKFFPDEKATN